MLLQFTLILERTVSHFILRHDKAKDTEICVMIYDACTLVGTYANDKQHRPTPFLLDLIGNISSLVGGAQSMM